jgi:hypothetical protein
MAEAIQRIATSPGELRVGAWRGPRTPPTWLRQSAAPIPLAAGGARHSPDYWIRAHEGDHDVRTTSTTKDRIGPSLWRFVRQSAVVGGLLALVLAGFVAGGRIGGTVAQEGTPPAGLGVEGAIFEPLAFGEVSELPQAPASFQLVRVRIAPGGHISVPAEDPGLVLIWVESGALTGTNTTPVRVLRAARLATPEAQTFEDVAAGAAFSVGPGDSFVGPPHSGGEYRNDGTDELVLWISGLSPEGAATPPA